MLAKELDKNRIKRIRVIDDILRTHPKGVTMKDIIGHVAKLTGMETNRFAVVRDIKILSSGLGMEIDVDTAISDKSGKVIKIYKYAHPNDSLFNIELDDEDRNFLAGAMAMIGFKGVGGLQLFKKLKLKSDYKPSIISFTKNPKERSIEAVFQNLFSAIKFNNVVSIRLRDRKPPYENVTHRVHPWYLREYNRRWYLFGLDDVSQEICKYSLDRIDLPIRILKRNYIAPDKSVDEILKDVVGVSIDQNEKVLDIFFWVSDESADYVSRKLIHSTQIEMSKAEVEERLGHTYDYIGGKFFNIQCINNYELRREMLSFGPELIVLYPNGLIANLADQLQKMLNNYK